MQRAFPSLQDVQRQLSGPWRAAVTLYNILPQGAFSADQLVSMQVVQTALGIERDEPLELSFERLADGSVSVSGIGPPARILYSRVACDGVLHVTSLQLVPASLGLPFPETNASLYELEETPPVRSKHTIQRCCGAVIRIFGARIFLCIIWHARAKQLYTLCHAPYVCWAVRVLVSVTCTTP